MKGLSKNWIESNIFNKYLLSIGIHPKETVKLFLLQI
jgi:hypothetical protein